MMAKILGNDLKVQTKLTSKDLLRLDQAAKNANRTRAAFIREGLLWYLDNLENLKESERDGKIAQAITSASEQLSKAIIAATNRVCALLSRQNVIVATLYELAWRACISDVSKQQFNEAVLSAKRKVSKKLEDDEKEISDRLKRVIQS